MAEGEIKITQLDPAVRMISFLNPPLVNSERAHLVYHGQRVRLPITGRHCLLGLEKVEVERKDEDLC